MAAQTSTTAALADARARQTGPVTQAIRAIRGVGNPGLHLLTDNFSSQPEVWNDRPRHTLVTFTLPKETVDGCWYGIRNLMEANRNMMLAVMAAQAGDMVEVEKQIDRAFAGMVSANAFAAKLYEHVRQSAQRKNRRGGRS